MEDNTITAQPLNRDSFSRFGDVIETQGRESITINNGMCKRFNNLSSIKTNSDKGQPSLSIFKSKHYSLPLNLKLLERHPFSSQAFMPLHSDPYLVIVADDIYGKPSVPEAFVTNGHQGVNIFKNTWHGVLTPIVNDCDFLVVDLSDCKENLEEFILPESIAVKTNL